MFMAFMKRGISLPHHLLPQLASFLWDPTSPFGSQQHLVVWAFTILSDGYLGIRPGLRLWCPMFHLKQQRNSPKLLHECSTTVITKQ
jgi:hypothetical protein